eukprot:gene16157-19227_t
MSINTFLNGRKISDILNSDSPYWKAKKEKSIITIDSTDTVKSCLEILSKNKILSLPVVEASTKDFLGFVDMVDILHSIIYFYSDSKSKNCENDCPQFAKWCEETDENMQAVTKKGREYASQPVSKIINQSKYDEFIPVDESGTLYQLLDEVLNKGVHRVLVYNEDAEVKGLVSQSDILKYLLENLDELGEDLHHPTPGVAVIDDDGKIVAHLSITTLRGLGPQSFQTLMGNVMDFYNNYVDEQKVVTCTRDTPLEVVLLTLYELGQHRIWVVESKESDKVIGLISLSDLMEYLVGRKENVPGSLNASQ